MATNSLRFEDRLLIGRQHEDEIILALNQKVIELDGKILYNWHSADREQDIYSKIDAFCSDQHNNSYSVQIKRRESGADVLVGVIRPWKGDEAFLEAYRGLSGDSESTSDAPLNYDRDVNAGIDFYVCQAEKNLLVAPYSVIQRAYTAILQRLYDHGGFKGERVFTGNLKGLQLRIVRDIGEGYTKDQEKLILFINFHTLASYGSWVGTL